MKTADDTSALIKKMVIEASQRSDQRKLSFEQLLLPAAFLMLAVSIALAFLIFGSDLEVVSILTRPPFLFKFVVMVALAAGALLLVRQAGQPGTGRLGVMALVPGLSLMAAGIALDNSAFPTPGVSAVSVLSCVGAIVLLSLPVLVAILCVLKCGVPTRPGRDGLMAGLLAGTIGGAAYAFVCKNDGAAFVAVWYNVAIIIVSILGSVTGRRLLAW